MKKISIVLLAAALVASAGFWPGQYQAVAEAAPHGVHGGGRIDGGGGNWRGGGGNWGHGGRGHGGGSFDVWFGPGWGWWDPFYYPYYPYYPSYTQPPVVIEQQPQEYVMPETQSEQTSYWYFCRNPQGYYPYVKRCPGGWMKVVPTPPAEEE
jgi:hypothetical protein